MPDAQIGFAYVTRSRLPVIVTDASCVVGGLQSRVYWYHGSSASFVLCGLSRLC